MEERIFVGIPLHSTIVGGRYAKKLRIDYIDHGVWDYEASNAKHALKGTIRYERTVCTEYLV